MRALRLLLLASLVAAGCGDSSPTPVPQTAFLVVSPSADGASNRARPVIRWTRVDAATRYVVSIYADAAGTQLLERAETPDTEHECRSTLADGQAAYVVVEATHLGVSLAVTARSRFRVTLRGSSLSYRDRLGLQTIEYYYSVVALSQRQRSPNYRTLTVSVGQAIRLSEANYRGLLAGANGSHIGSYVQLETHPLGTDYLGRDMLARLMWGARTSLFIGIVAPLVYVAMGLIYGGLAGYSGGRTDNFLMRFADFVIALPFLLFMILFKIAFGLGPGESGIGPMLIALVLLSWPATARLVRGQVLQIREQPYIAAARLMGASAPYLVLRHMLPNLMSVLLVSLTFAIPTAIFIEAFLSFIGMGVVPPTPSWGSMCNDGIRTMLSHPHELIFPALFISATVLAFNLLGDGLRDAMDARLRGDS